MYICMFVFITFFLLPSSLFIYVSAAISGVRDDYDYWKSAGYLPASGKPLWLTLEDDRCLNKVYQ